MKNLYLYVSAFSLLTAGSAYAALDCAALPSCADLGYTDKVEKCPSDVLKCPFDTTQGRCTAIIGEIRLRSGQTAPAGWKICDGSTLSSTTYKALYEVIGTTFGGNTTNFALPNFKGRVPVGVGYANSSTYTYTRGSTGGSEVHTLTESEMPKHRHHLKFTKKKWGDDANNRIFPDYNGTVSDDDVINGAGLSPYTQNTGGSAAHENRMPYLALYHIISYHLYRG